MGRAQIVQAEAARVAPQVDMNPILLKPTSETGSQVVLNGKALGNSSARDYHLRKEQLFGEACAALDRLRARFDAIVIEGAGSCAEVNLMAADIVNLRMARYAGAPVVLVADIHRGGVFAQIVGTLGCLSKTQRDQVRGCIVNRFRGDLSLFAGGVAWIEKRTGKPVFGVLPWFNHIRIESEDSVVIENPAKAAPGGRGSDADIAVIRLPHIANFTDFEPIDAVAGVKLHYVERLQDLGEFRAVILPGTKNTRFDLEWLWSTGWAAAINAYAQKGGHVLGICGGYQMLGRTVHDPQGHEGAAGSTPGLDLLPVETILKAPKTTTLTRFAWQGETGEGYEIHMGQTVRNGGGALFEVLSRNGRADADEDGCCREGMRVAGTYIHGLFDNPAITARWLAAVGIQGIAPPALGGLAARNREYDRLAAHVAGHVDVEAIIKLMEAQLP
jgi:adenosylcobyric acid synthase